MVHHDIRETRLQEYVKLRFTHPQGCIPMKRILPPVHEHLDQWYFFPFTRKASVTFSVHDSVFLGEYLGI